MRSCTQPGSPQARSDKGCLCRSLKSVWARSETLRELGVRHRAVPNGEDEAVPPTVSPLPPATRRAIGGLYVG